MSNTLNDLFKKSNKNSENCTVNYIIVFELNFHFLILIFNESFMGLHKWQHK